MKRAPIALTLLAFAGSFALTSCETVTAKRDTKGKNKRPMAQTMQKQKRAFKGY